MTKKAQIKWLLVLIILITLATFSPVRRAHFLNWDDEENVVYCRQIRSFSLRSVPWFFTNFTVGDFKPLAWITYTLDYSLWGLNPFGYHLGNLLLHAASSCFLFILIVRLANISGYRRPEPVLFSAFAATLFFALHPLRVESVAWISDRKGVLGLFFYLLSLLVYLKYAGRKKIRWYLLTLVLALASFLSKPVTVSLPLVLLFLDFYPLHRLKEGKGKLLAEKIPFFLLAAGTALMALIGQSRMDALTPLKSFGPGDRVLLAAKTTVFYLQKTVFPEKLSAAYPAPGRIRLLAPEFFLPPVILVLLSAGGIILWRKKMRWPLICWLWFLAALFPVSGFFRTGLVVTADRFTYLPAVALSGLAAVFLFWLSRRGGMKLAAPAAALVLIFFARRSFRQAELWQTSEKLWEDAVRRYPSSAVGRSHYGQILFQRGADEEAEAHLRGALELLQEKPYLSGDIVFAVRSNLAQSLGRLGRFSEGAALLEEILQTRNSWIVRHALAGIYRKMGKTEEAGREYEEALKKKPDWVPTLCDYGLLLAQSGRTEEAIGLYQRALLCCPGSPRARYNLALAFLDLGEKERGIRLLEGLASEYGDNYRPARALIVAYTAAGRETEAEEIRKQWEEREAVSDLDLPYARGEKPGLLFPLRE